MYLTKLNDDDAVRRRPRGMTTTTGDASTGIDDEEGDENGHDNETLSNTYRNQRGSILIGSG
jgi:hypothetical protein